MGIISKRVDFNYTNLFELAHSTMIKLFFAISLITSLALGSSGCLLLAGGAGAEAGYVAAQEDRKAGETVSDQWITSKIKSQLLADTKVSGLRINVDTHKAVVTLHGQVPSQSEIDHAVKIATNTKGVAKVISKLTVIDK
jgi:hypothetical protein